MGITSSKEEPNEMASLASQIDDIAVHYILNQNTIDLLRLTDKEYYDNLIILTSSIIDKKLDKLELGFLNNRVFGKKSITEIIDVMPASNKIKEKVVFNISKFYIKIIMIYSAIATTIDPQYSYETADGAKKTFYLKDIHEYKYIPKDVKPILVQLTNPMNLCRKRLDILKNKLDQNVDETYVKINPGEKLCSLKATSLLTDEVGIKELDSLYYDIFDYDTKTWNKRSKKMKQKYNKDLILFYQIFTGKKVKPSNIQSFHDIELLDMSTLDACNDVTFMQDILVHKNDSLIQEYIQKINMIESVTHKYRIKLTEILKELFVVKLNDNETKYTLNPELTMDHVILLETETRDTILNLYTSCEKYFIQGLMIFEKIYNQQVKTLNVERLNYIENIKTPPPEVLEVTPEPIFDLMPIGVSGEEIGVSGEPIIGVSGEQVGISGEPIIGVSGEQVGVSGEQVGVSGEQPSSIFGIQFPSFMSSAPKEEFKPASLPETISQQPTNQITSFGQFMTPTQEQYNPQIQQSTFAPMSESSSMPQQMTTPIQMPSPVTATMPVPASMPQQMSPPIQMPEPSPMPQQMPSSIQMPEPSSVSMPNPDMISQPPLSKEQIGVQDESLVKTPNTMPSTVMSQTPSVSPAPVVSQAPPLSPAPVMSQTPVVSPIPVVNPVPAVNPVPPVTTTEMPTPIKMKGGNISKISKKVFSS